MLYDFYFATLKLVENIVLLHSHMIELLSNGLHA